MKSSLTFFIITLLFTPTLQADVALLINSYHVGHGETFLQKKKILEQ